MKIWKPGLLVRMTMGFVPLLLFVVAEAIWGTTVGMGIGISVGLAAFLLIWWRERRLDWFVVLDTALLTVLGVVGIIFDVSLFFKLKPAAFDAVFGVLLALSIWGPRNFVAGLLLRMSPQDSSPLMSVFPRLMKGLFWVCAAHAALILSTIFIGDDVVWAFAAGPAWYLMAGFWFMVEIGRMMRMKARFLNSRQVVGLVPLRAVGADVSPERVIPAEVFPAVIGRGISDIREEVLPVIDEKGMTVGKAGRNQCHALPGLLHPVVRLLVFDNQARVFLQQRSAAKDSWPGAWDSSAAGHIGFGETIDQALEREVEEELGVKLSLYGEQLRYMGSYRIDEIDHLHADRELSFLFLLSLKSDEEFHVRVSKAEIQDTAWVDLHILLSRGSPLSGEILTPHLSRDIALVRQSLGAVAGGVSTSRQNVV